MKQILSWLVVFFGFSFNANARVYRCEGRVEIKPGQIRPIVVQLLEMKDKVWYVELYGTIIEAGRDHSQDPNVLNLNNYHGRQKNQVRAHLDIREKKLILAYDIGDQSYRGGMLSNCREVGYTQPVMHLPCDSFLDRLTTWWEGL